MIEGSDGRIYFTYGKGAQYALYQGNRQILTLIIDDCMYDSEKKREKYEISRAYMGIVESSFLPYEQSELAYLLDMGNAQEIQEGEAVEYPLIEEEVSLFFQTIKVYRDRERRTADKLMKQIPEYRQIISAQEEVEKLLSSTVASVANSEDVKKADELSFRYAEICRKRGEILKDNGVDPKLFDLRAECHVCQGYGITPNGICKCAQKRGKEIKDWNAARRLARKFSTSWIDFTIDEEQEEAKAEITEGQAKLSAAEGE